MKLLIVSDLHVRGENDPCYRSLLRLLREGADGGDTVVLAGDIFDLFVGKKAVFLERYTEFAQALAKAGGRGVRIHYIEGNHDFLLREAFGELPGVSVHSDHVALELGGKRFLIQHGDRVDTSDYGYRFLRAAFRSVAMRAIVRVCPGSWLDAFGRWSSRYSREQRPMLPSEFQTERLERLRKLYRSYAAERIAEGCDFLVLGHCHDLDEMSFTVNGRIGQYINVGYPPVHGSYLSWSPGEGKIQRERLP
ncbi:MAG: UDP-2,3-diacylglucosamine diphosphatase [Oligoflexia bacterium]|nr:UDP-2,3-diacylglucosamine diphosphatase [Oligoflexia bacterium]